MGLDHSGLTINTVSITKFKNRTMAKVIAKYVDDPKPLFMVNAKEGRLYIGGKEEAVIWRGSGKGWLYCAMRIWNDQHDMLIHYPHPEKTMEAIDRLEAICPAFAAWLIFNIEPLFAT